MTPGAGASRSRCAGRRRAATRRCSRSARRPRRSTPSRASGWPSTATRRRSSTWPRCASSCVEETGLLPHANAGAISRDELELLAGVSVSQGMMLETPARGPAVPPRRAGQAPGAPARDARGRRRAEDPVHDGHPGRASARTARTAIDGAAGDRRQPRPPRPRAGGDRPELPAQARHRDARPPAVPGGGPPGRDPRSPARSSRATCTCRRRRTSRATSARCSTRASTTGAACPRSPPTSSTRSGRGRRWSACARPPRPPASSSRRAWPSTPSSSTGRSRRRLRFATLDRADAEGLGRDDPGAVLPQRFEDVANVADGAEVQLVGRRSTAWYSGADAQPMELPLTGEPRGAIKEVLDGARAGQELGRRARSSRSSARAGRTSAPSPQFADELRPRGGRRHGHVRPHPQHQLHEPLHLQVQVLRVREGPAEPEPARQAVPADARGDRRPRPRGVGRGRHRGVPAGRHPPDLRRRLLLAGVQGRPRRGAGDPRARLHRARGHRGRAPPARAARGLPAPDEGRGPALAARHRRRDPRRPDPRDPVPGQDRHRRVARGAPDRALASACARTSRSCSARSSRPSPGRATSSARATCRRRPAASPSSCRCRSCTWPRRSTSSAPRAAARRSARRC